MTAGPLPPPLTRADLRRLIDSIPRAFHFPIPELDPMHKAHLTPRDAEADHQHLKGKLDPEKPTRRTHAQQVKRGVKQRPKSRSR